MTTKATLPDFLVIGAMKAGTTSLYFDLLHQPELELPDKESNALLQDCPEQALEKAFPRAKSGRIRGEVCPDYTKPGSDAVAARQALRLSANESGSSSAPKLVYIVREPIARLRSHHHFISTQYGSANPESMTRDLESSIQNFPALVKTSCYASRLQPWIDAFGSDPDRLLIIRFEDFVAKRRDTITELANFLGLKNLLPNQIDATKIYNAGTTRPVATPGWRRVIHHPLYRNVFRPLLPLGFRERIRNLVLPKPPPRPPAPKPETLDRLIETFRPEIAELSTLAGKPVDEPLWDLNEVRSMILRES